MDIKTAIDVLKGLKYRLGNPTSEADRIIIEALDVVTNSDICEKRAEVLYICDHKKCKTCSYPTCRYTTDISHAGSFVVNEIGMYKEIELKTKKKSLKGFLKGVIKTNENT